MTDRNEIAYSIKVYSGLKFQQNTSGGFFWKVKQFFDGLEIV